MLKKSEMTVCCLTCTNYHANGRCTLPRQGEECEAFCHWVERGKESEQLSDAELGQYVRPCDVWHVENCTHCDTCME